MDVTLQSLLALMRQTASDPKEGARRVLALDLPVAALWQALAVLVIASVILTEFASLLVPGGGMMATLRANPVMAGAVQFALLFVMVHALHRIGAALGGTGGLAGSLHLVVWLQTMLLALQLVQIVALMILPPLAGMIGLVALLFFFWLLTSFVMVLHGFRSPVKVLLGIVLSFVAIVFALSTVLAMLGVVVVPEGV